MNEQTNEADETRAVYPAFLRLQGRRAVIVGGGPVAASKLGPLLAAGARVSVVAPSIHPDMRREGVVVYERPFRTRDLNGAWFVVAAAPPEINQHVVRAAERRRVFVNAVDDASLATAYLGSVVERGGVTVAISTGGRAPALAGLLREGLDAVLPEDLAYWVGHAEGLRPAWRAEGVPHAQRRTLLLESLVRLYESRTHS